MILRKDLKIPSPEMKVPIVEKTLAKITTRRILVTPFFQNPFIVLVSSERSSKSLTLGFLIIASTMPANQPAAIRGLSEVIGAAMKAVMIERIWPPAKSVPIALREPFHSSQILICSSPISRFLNRV